MLNSVPLVSHSSWAPWLCLSVESTPPIRPVNAPFLSPTQNLSLLSCLCNHNYCTILSREQVCVPTPLQLAGLKSFLSSSCIKECVNSAVTQMWFCFKCMFYVSYMFSCYFYLLKIRWQQFLPAVSWFLYALHYVTLKPSLLGATAAILFELKIGGATDWWSSTSSKMVPATGLFNNRWPHSSKAAP